MELQFVILLSVCCSVTTEKSKNSVLYYTVKHHNDVFRVPASGGVAESLNLSKPHCDSPYAIAHDIERNCLYWTNTGSRKGIGRNCQGNVSSIALPGMRGGVTVDPVRNLLYTTDYENDVVQVVDFDKETRSTLVSRDISFPYGIVEDPQGGWLYWAEWEKGTLEKVRTNSTQRMQLVENVSWPHDVALNRGNSRLYFCGWHSVQSIGVDGSGRQTHFEDGAYIFSSIAVDDQFLYVRSYFPSACIWRLAIDSVNATDEHLHKITDIGSQIEGGIVLVEPLIQETTTVDVNDVTATTVARTVTSDVGVPSAKATILFEVETTKPSSGTLQDIYKYALLTAVPIMLVVIIVFSACFCIKTGKCASCRRTDDEQNSDVYYEDVSAIPMSHRPLPAIAQGENGAATVPECDDYLIPVPLASGTRGESGASAAPKCTDYLVPVSEPPHTYEEI